MRIINLTIASLLGAATAVTGAGGAHAQLDYQDTTPTVPYEVYEVHGCDLTVWLTNPTGHTTYLVVQAGDELDVVEAEAGEQVSSGPHDLNEVGVQYRIFGGPERDWDSPAWTVERDDLVAYIDEHGDQWVTAGRGEAPGWVTWHSAEVDGCEVVEDDKPAPSPSPTTPVEETAPPADDEGGEAGELPATGSPVAAVAAGAVALVAAGGGLVWLTRRRQQV